MREIEIKKIVDKFYELLIEGCPKVPEKENKEEFEKYVQKIASNAKELRNDPFLDNRYGYIHVSELSNIVEYTFSRYIGKEYRVVTDYRMDFRGFSIIEHNSQIVPYPKY